MFLSGISLVGIVKRKLKKLMCFQSKNVDSVKEELKDKQFPLLSCQQKDDLSSALKISFTGDLILLRDMVETAWDDTRKEYDFAPMFQYVKPIWKKADLSLGVFEGVLAGDGISYSTSNFDDDIPLRLNFPDTFADALKESGMDLVTLANNHMFDCGNDGLMRTLDVLDEKKLMHVGAYRTIAEKQVVCIVNVKGLRIAVLPFTYCPNNVSEDFFVNDCTSHLTQGIVSKDSPFFEQIKNQALQQLENAKKQSPDLVIALPHMGTQFSDKPDEMQIFWSRFFAYHGADIVFGCHAHHIQPIEWIEKENDKKSLIVYCPGNFVNSYTNHDGDLSTIINAYVNFDTKEVFAIGAIPIYASTNEKGHFIGVPISSALKNSVSYREYKHISDLQLLFSRIILNEKVSIDQCQDEYFVFQQNGYFRNKVQPIEIEANHNSVLYSLIERSSCVCFVGDSITEGTKNGGYGWFEPLMACFPQKSYLRYASGGKTVSFFKKHHYCFDNNGSDLYVIAIGCNDIRYRDPSICAMNATVFVEDIDSIAQSILKNNPKAIVVFVAPWGSAPFDPYCPLSIVEKKELYSDYSNSLEKLCLKKGYTFIDPNPYLELKTDSYRRTDMLKDHIHPDANDGVRLYSMACLNG